MPIRIQFEDGAEAYVEGPTYVIPAPPPAVEEPRDLGPVFGVVFFAGMLFLMGIAVGAF